MENRRDRRRKSKIEKFHGGQVALLLILALVAIAIAAFAAVDAFLSMRAKYRLQNGGDAAAIAAAKTQGDLIAEIGRLNIERLLAAFEDDKRTMDELELDQRRLALLGPVRALEDADFAARENGLEKRDEFSTLLLEHVEDIRMMYAGGEGADDAAYPESYPGAWTEYATEIRRIAEAGIAAGPDNMEFYYSTGDHFLSNRDFYNAIAAEDWCWFLFHCENLLHNYVSWKDWGGADVVRRNTMENSEIFSLHLHARKCALLDVFTKNEIVSIVRKYAGRTISEEDFEAAHSLANAATTWFFFDTHYWRTWFTGKRLLTDDENMPEFPLSGEVKPVHNILGCSAVVRVDDEVPQTATGGDRMSEWTAAAKPFGVMEGLKGEEVNLAGVKSFVLPFSPVVRLIPVDAAEGGNLSTSDVFWVEHLRRHVPAYLATGGFSAGCFYCTQLKRWEQPSFRQRGITWLKFHSGECFRPVGGRGGTGGTRRAH